MRGAEKEQQHSGGSERNFFSAYHLTAAPLPPRQVRTASPFPGAGWGLAADFNLKPPPGDNVIAPLSLRVLPGRGSPWQCKATLPPHPRACVGLQPKHTSLGVSPQDFR